jgi:hypothetical protein
MRLGVYILQAPLLQTPVLWKIYLHQPATCAPPLFTKAENTAGKTNRKINKKMRPSDFHTRARLWQCREMEWLLGNLWANYHSLWNAPRIYWLTHLAHNQIN